MNHTTVVEFVLLGLTNSCHLEIILFLFLVIAYFLILLGNITVISITLANHFLQTLVYYFLRNFALLEISFTSTFIPRTLYSLLTERKIISLPDCFLQMLLFFYLGTCTFFHVAAMSFDRYVAICRPLHYTTIMNNSFCLQLVLACWAVSFLLMFPPTIMTVQLPFCGPNVMNHFYCDTSLLLQLSCTDTGFIEGLMLSILIIIIPGTLILIVTTVSCSCIITTILHIPSSTDRKKAFSTCSAHLMVVIFYSTCIYRYICPAQRGGQDSDKVLSFFFSMMTQIFNLCIYSLRNNQVKQALNKSMKQSVFLSEKLMRRRGSHGRKGDEKALTCNIQVS
ncbi:olfactory receptor 6C74-like [Egretta garzetta]|uniref:olfactory receptor 6C74-like n=1 Tax=Egretta garzetta TaxID=188379 RepID=UPI00163C442F|nr:olfactory receptor 6C74-like [Egretta garzetta]